MRPRCLFLPRSYPLLNSSMFNSIIISIINTFAFHRHHKLIECLVIHKLDVRCELQSSSDATTVTCIGKKIDAMIE